MADRPIIFSGPMVRALLAGRKTQTRRLATSPLRRCEVGDRLYVRESYMPIPWTDEQHPNRWNLAYAASGSGDHVADAPPDFNPMLYSYERWTPSIHMPRWASRLTLVVKAVRFEPLRAISEEDAVAEGVEYGPAARHLPSKWILGRCRDCAHWNTSLSPNGGKRRSCPYHYGDADPLPSYGDAGQGCSTSFKISDGAEEAARFQFLAFWDHLHVLNRARDNPDVLAITFRVEHGNIDRLAA